MPHCRRLLFGTYNPHRQASHYYRVYNAFLTTVVAMSTTRCDYSTLTRSLPFNSFAILRLTRPRSLYSLLFSSTHSTLSTYSHCLFTGSTAPTSAPCNRVTADALCSLILPVLCARCHSTHSFTPFLSSRLLSRTQPLPVVALVEVRHDGNRGRVGGEL